MAPHYAVDVTDLQANDDGSIDVEMRIMFPDRLEEEASFVDLSLILLKSPSLFSVNVYSTDTLSYEYR